MAHECLKHYHGNAVAYVGEGSGGCTGDDAFHGALQISSQSWIPYHWGMLTSCTRSNSFWRRR